MKMYFEKIFQKDCFLYPDFVYFVIHLDWTAVAEPSLFLVLGLKILPFEILLAVILAVPLFFYAAVLKMLLLQYLPW